MIDPFTGASAVARFFLSVGKFIGQAGAFLAKPAVQLGLMVAQGVMSHQAAMKAKRTGADILLQKYGTGGGIPVIYGTRRVAGTVVYMETQNNRELYVVYAIAAHEIDSFDLESIQLDGRTIKDTNIYRQGYDISDGTTRINFRPSSVTRASGTFWGNTSAERTNITDPANTGDNARMTFNCHKGTTTQAADPMLEGILTNWTSSHKLTGIAYIAANYEYDTQGMFTGIPNLTVVVNGKKVFDPRDTGQTFGTESTYTHSSNAALCLLDYITNDDYGKGLGTSDLESDFASWKTAADDCDTSVDTIDHTGISVESASTESDVMIIADASQAKFNKLKVGNKYTVDDGTTTYVNNKKLIDKDSTQIDIDGSNAFAILKLKFEDGAIDNAITSATSCDFAETQIRFDCNGVLDTEETVLENTKLLIANMRGIFTYANGKYQIKVEGTESSVVTLDEDDILESGITLSLENKEAKYNKVEAEFYNAQKRYESDTTYYTGETSDTFLADDGNEVLETRIQLPFCTNQRIAYNHAKGLLKRSRKQKTISFVATPKVLKAKVGEVITVSNTNLNLSSELYRITNMTINPDLNIAVTAIEYQTDVYGYVTPPDEDIDIPDDPPEGNRVVAPTNLTFTNKNATTGEAAKLTWTDSTKYPSYEFRVRIIDGLKTRYDKRVKDTYFYLDGISVKNGYEARVSAINALGVESDSTNITVNVTTEPITTPDIKQGSIGGFSFTDSKMYHPVDGSDTGVFETSNVYIDDAGQFSLKDKLSFDGTDLTIDGDITATTGTIGGFSIGNNFLTAGSATSRIKLSTADGIHMGNDTFALAPFNVTKSGQVTATDLILKKGNVTYFDSTDGFSAEAIAQIASSLNTRVQTFAFSSENNTDYATIETTEDSQDIKLVVRANASSLQGSGTSEALAIAEIPDNLTIKIEFDDNTSFTSPTTIGSLQTYNASTDGTPTTSEYEIETLDLSALGGDFSAFVLGNDGAVNASGDIVYTVSSYTVATAGTYYFRVIYDTTDTSYNATNDPDSFTRSLEIEDLSGSGFLISNGSSGSQTSDAVTLTGTQTITGAKTFSATTTFSGDVNISGDLSVTGTTTTIDTATLNVEDKNITLNYSTGDSSSTADGAGITIQDAVNSTTDATITWDATNDEFDFSHDINVTGTVTATSFSGDGSGLTGISGSTTTINNNADNRVITGSNTANTLNGEANLTFDGSSLGVTGAINASGNIFANNGEFTGSFLYTSGDLRIGTSTGATNQTGIIKHNGTTYGLGLFNWGDANPIFIGGSEVNFRTESGSAIALKSNGTTFLDASRNLTNIGTISSGAITTTGNYTLQKNIPMIRFISADGSSNSYSISGNINNTVDGGFYIQEGTTNGTNVRLSIDATGDVGIGKINASQKLDVQGNIGISGTEVIDISRNLTNIASITANNGITQVSGSNQIDLTTDGSIEITRGAGGAYIDFKDSASEDYDQRLASTSTGFNLGNLITETNTNKNSLINDWVTVGTGSRGGALRINDIAGANYAIRCGSYDLTFYKDVSGTSWSEVMRFDGNSASNSSVNVVIANSLGIGTNNPLAPLHVDGNVYVDTGHTLFSDIIRPYSTFTMQLGGSGSDIAYFTGKVGIGTQSPRHKLSVNGTLGSSTFSGFGMGVIGGLATAESGNTNRAIGIQSHATSDAKFFAYDYGASAGIPISIQPDNANVYLCAGGGNVGVGSSGASYTLDVNGTFAFRSTGYAYDSNFYAYNSGSGTYLRFGNDGTSGLLTMTGAQNLSIQGQGSGSTTFWGDIKVGASTVITSGRQLENTRIYTTSASTHQIDSQQGNSAYNDTLFLRNTTNGGHMRLGMSSNDSDGQHHRVTLRAQKGSGSYEGELVMQIRAAGGGFNDRFLFGSTGDLHADGNVVAYSTSVSDKKFKDNVVNLDNSLDKVLQLRGVEFDWNATTRKGTHDVGLIAQEVEAVVPEVVTEHEIKIGEFADNPVTSKTVAYDKLVPLLVEAIKELKAEIEELKK